MRASSNVRCCNQSGVNIIDNLGIYVLNPKHAQAWSFRCSKILRRTRTCLRRLTSFLSIYFIITHSLPSPTTLRSCLFLITYSPTYLILCPYTLRWTFLTNICCYFTNKLLINTFNNYLLAAGTSMVILGSSISIGCEYPRFITVFALFLSLKPTPTISSL